MFFPCYGVITHRHFELSPLIAFMQSLQSYGAVHLGNCSRQIYGFYPTSIVSHTKKQFAH